MVFNPIFLETLPVTKPTVIGIGIVALVMLYLAFKVGKFVIKMLLVLAALIAIGLAAWSYYNPHHGSL